MTSTTASSSARLAPLLSRRRIRTVVLVFVLLLLLAVGKARSSKSTRVSGHGSRWHADISSYDTEDRTIGAGSNALLHLRQAHGETVSYIKTQNDTILELKPGGSIQYSSSHDAFSDWTPVQGLYGVYTLASGQLWVWIAASTPVYEAPGSDWWTIHRVTQLHSVYVPSRKGGENRHEERRQLALLRQSLQDHCWYYCTGSVVPNLTVRLQDCLASAPVAVTTDDDSLRSLQTNTSISEGNHLKAEMDSPWSPWWFPLTARTLDSRFFWNQAVVEPLMRAYHQARINGTENPYQDLLQCVIPVTSAFCGVRTNLSTSTTTTARESALVYDHILLSRRSRYRAGTRFSKRGADAAGAVANYAETEQIIVVYNATTAGCNQQLIAVTSHVQTRGSIPLRWSSPTDIKTYRPRVRIGTNPLAQARALRAHLIDQASRYVLLLSPKTTTTTMKAAVSKKTNPGLLFVNLVDKHSDQGRLGSALDSVLTAVLDVYTAHPDQNVPWLNSACIKHLWFDFHAEVKSGRWDRLMGLLEQVTPSLMEHGYYKAVPIYSDEKGIVSFQTEKVQTGVIRTNCMDCLDRTNVVQSIFGRFMLFRQLVESSKKIIPLSFRTAMRQNAMALPWTRGEVAHRLLWADNADAISRLYAGTPALKGDFTRTGKRTKRGALDDGMNSVQRYYLNNFLDADRQEGMDLLTGHQRFSNAVEDNSSIDLPDGDFYVGGSGHDETVRNKAESRHAVGINGTATSIQEAARLAQQLGLTINDDQYSSSSSSSTFGNADAAGEEDHVRIKVTSSSLSSSIGAKKKQQGLPRIGLSERKHPFVSPVGGAVGQRRQRRPLDLLWLPGDLRSQFRALVSDSSLVSSINNDTSRQDDDYDDALDNVDRRSEANLPWWVVSTDEDSSWDTNDSFVGGTKKRKKQPSSADTMAAAAVPSVLTNVGFFYLLMGALVAGIQVPLAMVAVIMSLLLVVSATAEGVEGQKEAEEKERQASVTQDKEGSR
jgi:hypothetical protein